MKWNKGNPPEPGWYPATRVSSNLSWNNGYKWWDGERWSWYAFPHETAYMAARWAAKKEVAGHNSEIMWGTPQTIN